MAHNIALSVTGTPSMVYEGRTPWHGLGTRIASGTTFADALRLAGLDFNVSKQPLFFADGTPATDCYATRRDDDGRTLGAVGKDYRVHPYSRPDGKGAFDVADRLVQDFGCSIATLGGLGNGERAWILLRMPDAVEVVDGDKCNGYLLVVASHDGSTANVYKVTDVRVVCQNTMTMALGHGAELARIRHSGDVGAKMDRVAKLVHSATAALQARGETYRAFARRGLTATEATALIEATFPQDDAKPSQVIADRQATVAYLMAHGKGAEFAPGTAWSLLNAVTEYLDHVRPAEAVSATAKASANASALFGNGAALKVQTFDRLRQLVAA